MNFLIIFVVLSIVNVVFSTVRSIVTVKGNKWTASLLSAGYFAYYNIVLVYTVADFPMWQKCLITFIANAIGVFVVKLIEEKMQKEKLWLVKCTIPNENVIIDIFQQTLKTENIPFTYYNLEKYIVFDCYCDNKAATKIVINSSKKANGKYFAIENRLY